MRKNIDIPDEILQDLKILAVKENKDLKNFIQDHLILLVYGEKKEKAAKKYTCRICKSIERDLSS